MTTMKILLVHNDKFPWAASQRAEALKKELGADIAYCEDLPDGDSYDVIHFLYSRGISEKKDYILKHRNKVFTTMASERTFKFYYDKKEDLIEIYGQTVCCVAQNPKLAEMTRELIGQDNVVYIPNGVDTELFSRKFTVGFVGEYNSRKHKGYDLIKQACLDLDIDFIDIGGGVSRLQMPAFYRSIDCLALASESEGCNNPILEALAMNRPVISTDTGIASELDGVTIVERNIPSIRQALKKLSGRLKIIIGYSWPIIAGKYQQLYVEKLGTK